MDTLSMWSATITMSTYTLRSPGEQWFKSTSRLRTQHNGLYSLHKRMLQDCIYNVTLVLKTKQQNNNKNKPKASSHPSHTFFKNPTTQALTNCHTHIIHSPRCSASCPPKYSASVQWIVCRNKLICQCQVPQANYRWLESIKLSSMKFSLQLQTGFWSVKLVSDTGDLVVRSTWRMQNRSSHMILCTTAVNWNLLNMVGKRTRKFWNFPLLSCSHMVIRLWNNTEFLAWKFNCALKNPISRWDVSNKTT